MAKKKSFRSAPRIVRDVYKRQVIDHRKAKADGEKQAGKMIELEGRPAAGGGESGLDSKPSHEDRGERAEKILAHCVEEAEVLGKQVVDRLKDVLQEIGLHRGQLPTCLLYTSRCV